MRRFASLDADGNGVLEKRDFELSTTRVLEEFGAPAGSAAATKLQDATMAVWTHLVRAADQNSDDKISKDEFANAVVNGLLDQPASYNDTYQPYLNALMDIVDPENAGIAIDTYLRCEPRQCGWLSVEVQRHAFARLRRSTSRDC